MNLRCLKCRFYSILMKWSISNGPFSQFESKLCHFYVIFSFISTGTSTCTTSITFHLCFFIAHSWTVTCHFTFENSPTLTKMSDQNNCWLNFLWIVDYRSVHEIVHRKCKLLLREVFMCSVRVKRLLSESYVQYRLWLEQNFCFHVALILRTPISTQGPVLRIRYPGYYCSSWKRFPAVNFDLPFGKLMTAKQFDLTLIRESQKKNPKRGTVTERVLRKKIQSAALCYLYMFLCFGFFSEIALGDGSKNGIYFCSVRHISSHIGICHLKLTS